MPTSLISTGVQFPDNSIQTTSLPSLFTQSLGAGNGYQKFPGGLIIQWGINTASTVTFPIAFPIACRSVMATGNSGGSGRTIRVKSFTTTTFLLTADYCCVNAVINSCWIAVGY